jgi:hypothetical protein
MQATEQTFPPLALALGRLRQPRPAPRGWPYAATTRATTDAAAPVARPQRQPENDFLRLLPEPALFGELPVERPAPPANPGPEAAPATNRFDL